MQRFFIVFLTPVWTELLTMFHHRQLSGNVAKWHATSFYTTKNASVRFCCSPLRLGSSKEETSFSSRFFFAKLRASPVEPSGVVSATASSIPVGHSVHSLMSSVLFSSFLPLSLSLSLSLGC